MDSELEFDGSLDFLFRSESESEPESPERVSNRASSGVPFVCAAGVGAMLNGTCRGDKALKA